MLSRLIFTVAVFGFIYAPTVLSNDIDSSLNQPHRSKRAISHGVKSKIEEFPYMVQLEFVNFNPAFLCGGSIIKPRYILTAAHCFMHSRNPSKYKVWAGSSHILRNDVRTEVHNVVNITIFPHYDVNVDFGDLAILRLDKPIELDFKTKRPIAMFDPGVQIKPGSVAMVAGWGYLEEGGSFPDQLMKVALKVVDLGQCNATYKSHGYLHLGEGLFCAAGDEKLKSICAGDSGGPLVVEGRLAGVSAASDSAGCYSWPLPNIFTEVSYFRKWIDESVLELGQGGSNKEQAMKKIFAVKGLINKARQASKSVTLPKNWTEKVDPQINDTEDILRDMFDQNITECDGVLNKSKSIFKKELQSYIREKIDEQVAADKIVLDLTDRECRNVTQKIRQCPKDESESGSSSCDWIKIEAQADRMQKLLEDISKASVSDLIESIIDEKKELISSMIRKDIISPVAICITPE